MKQRLTRKDVPPEQVDVAANLTMHAYGGQSPIDDPGNWNNAKTYHSRARRTASKTDQHGGARGGHLPIVDPTARLSSEVAEDVLKDAMRLTIETAVVGPTPAVTWYTKGSWRVARPRANGAPVGITDRQAEAYRLRHVEGLTQRKAAERMGIRLRAFQKLLKKAEKTEGVVKTAPVG